jgi:hypothetical protein
MLGQFFLDLGKKVCVLDRVENTGLRHSKYWPGQVFFLREKGQV